MRPCYSHTYLVSCDVYFVPPTFFICCLYYAGQRGLKGERGPSPIGLQGFIGQKGHKGRAGLPGLSMFVDKRNSPLIMGFMALQALRGDLEIQA